MKKWNLVIDVAKCHDCNNCFLSCKDEFYQNDFPPYSAAQPLHGQRWMNIFRKERGQYPKVDVAYLPTPCMHCDSAPCVAKGEGAVYKRDDGIVIIDPEKARGKKGIVDACPYGAIYWNEEKEVPQKCTFCAHLLDDGWTQPRCVQVCPTGALSIHYVEDAEMGKIKEAEKLEEIHPEYGTKPRVYYKNLYRYTKHFIAGHVALQVQDECAEGAKVTLVNELTKSSAVTVTNNYGDFKFDNLESGRYTVEVEYGGFGKQSRTVELDKSINLGTFFL
ncbi:MAG: carboxypeptidase regulatory-like domain-containing protein [Peptococcaceae bacterium]|nr:carboxypeptidase regulatory-like domain-containing protein [Peptococcaceae bacterium]